MAENVLKLNKEQKIIMIYSKVLHLLDEIRNNFLINLLLRTTNNCCRRLFKAITLIEKEEAIFIYLFLYYH